MYLKIRLRKSDNLIPDAETISDLGKPKKSFSVILFFLQVFISCYIFSSCVEPEKPQPVITDPEVQLIEINADNLATHYYSLSRKKIISSSKITDWDLRICAQPDKYYFYLNTGKNMRIARYKGKFSDSIKPGSISNWQMDLMKDGKALTAMGSWGDFTFSNPKSFGYTYIIDLGYLTSVDEFGYRKIEILGCTSNKYLIKYGKLNDKYGDTISIEKKAGVNNIYLSLASGAKEVNIEPPYDDWDLSFTQYGLSSQVIKNGIIVDTLYSWTDMVLLNQKGRQVAIDTIKLFDDITFWDAEKYVYSGSIDFIGNKWRYFNPLTKAYEIKKNNTYILKNSLNNIYKIEFKTVNKSNPRITKIEFKVKNL